MKKIILSLLIFIFTASTISAEEKTPVPDGKKSLSGKAPNEFIGKLGTGYASDPGKFGLDISLNYIYNIDPVFVFGLEADFFWIKWQNELQDVNAGGSANGTLTAETNLYTVPFFANAQIRLPFLKEKIHVEPAITIGLGYCFMVLDYTSDSESDTDIYGGFAWQTFASLYYKIFEKSAVDFVLDLGYRDLSPKKDRVEIDMSGVFTRIGVRMYL
jgi:hypothetical protein